MLSHSLKNKKKEKRKEGADILQIIGKNKNHWKLTHIALITLILIRHKYFPQILWEMYQAQFVFILKGLVCPTHNTKFFLNSPPGWDNSVFEKH